MYFQHSADIWAEFPELVVGVVFANRITPGISVANRTTPFTETAASRLATGTEGEFPEIQAWRRAFSRMGFKPTQYRCAAESLLRRFRKERSLPQIHPLIDLCNAISLGFAVPIAVFDVAQVNGGLTVRHATGDESHLTFAGETEHPEPREVIFADDSGRAHARRWTNRQSRYSAVSDSTGSVLVVAEAMHDTALADVQKLTAAVAEELGATSSSATRTAMLTASSPRFEFGADSS
ncbi:MAG TPA: phenylalanine--tRNA ligase beta subunit-related protein [Amycolatopsis sp.]|uniref:B3/B4 domain-containing protein n=1 Tax=Amycolatopsis sp. TaxID=37632 RepID=UPI002B471DFD|nr:phenylalanine--tRNA ligase beta subunit-related protein [Amycolatopsis sp.]HKS46398.1 phenylalanine--tRNA ligase beta subunit-related protein [Amycolatopsis sp.]